MIPSEPKVPSFTVLSANASMTGRPAIVLTENKLSVRSSDMPKSCPEAPATEKIVDPDPSTVNSDPDICTLPVTLRLLPSNIRLDSAFKVVELTEVIILLSAALVYDVIPALPP
jgi:hypothetical protein